jgi:two-component system response regulator FlrC
MAPLWSHDSTLEEVEPGSQPGNDHSAILWVLPEPARVSWLEDDGALEIGRDEESDIVLDGAFVSRRHARLQRVGPTFLLADRGSRNGMYVNGQPATEAMLQHGDVVRFGDCLGLFMKLPRGFDPSYGLLAENLFGGPDLAAALAQLPRLAASDVPVVVVGETGTGKEQVARAVHRSSGRAGAFVAVNSALYNATSAVSELFGYRKGAFTGAERAHSGQLRAAEGGTVLLDEITDLPLVVQAQLLRAIENREIVPLGESHPVGIDVRFIATSQTPLEHAVDEGRFRADLRARLEGAEIVLPPLRARRGDTGPLFLHLLRRHAGYEIQVDPKVIERLYLHHWSLNVRELTGLVRRLVAAFPEERAITFKHLQQVFGEARRMAASLPPPSHAPESASSSSSGELRIDSRRAALLEALKRCDGNMSRAAQELNISRQSAYRLLKSG